MQADHRAAALPARMAGQPRRRHHRHQALVAAPRRADGEQPQCIGDALGGVRLRAFEHERHQPVGAPEIALPQRVARIVRQRRMEHRPDARLRLQPVRHAQGIASVLRHAHRQRAQAAQGQVGIVRADGQAQHVVRGGQARGNRLGAGNHRAQHHIRMAGDVLGGGQHRHIGARIERPEQDARGPGVVGRQHDPVPARHAGDRRQIVDLVEQRARRFRVDQPRLRADGRFEPAVGRIGIRQLDAQPLQQPGIQPAHGRIHAVRHHHVVARRQQRQERQRNRRQAGRHQERTHTAFQREQRLLQRAMRLRAMAAVARDVLTGLAAGLHVALAGDAGVAHRAGPLDGYVDRRGAPTERLERRAACMDDARGERLSGRYGIAAHSTSAAAGWATAGIPGSQDSQGAKAARSCASSCATRPVSHAR